MRGKAQEKLTVEISVDDNASEEVKQKYSAHAIELTGHTASAFRELYEAEHFGVYKGRIDLDALARFDQLGVPFRRFHSRRDSGDARKENWLRLDFPRGVQARVVAEVMA